MAEWLTQPDREGMWQYWLLGSTISRFQTVFEHRGELCVNNGEGPMPARKTARLWIRDIEKREPPQDMLDELERRFVPSKREDDRGQNP